MKYLKILILVVAMAALFCVSALAAETGVVESGTEDWTYTATLVNSEETPVATGDENMYLLLVLSGTKTTASITADDILYIDQTTAHDVSGTATVTFSEFIPKNYGGGSAYFTGTTLTSPVNAGELTSHGILGDVSGNALANSTDARYILQYKVGLREFDSTQIRLADVNNSGTVNSTDARFILEKAVGKRDSNFNLVA